MKYIIRIVTGTIYSLIVALTINILRPIALKIENKKVHVIVQNKLKNIQSYEIFLDLQRGIWKNLTSPFILIALTKISSTTKSQ